MRAPLALAALVLAATTAYLAAAPRPLQPDERPAELVPLEAAVGSWNAVVRIYRGDREIAQSKGVERNRFAVGGLWLLSDFEGEMAGRPYAGHAIIGYDPEKKRYVQVWVDSLSREMVAVEGRWDARSKRLVMENPSRRMVTDFSSPRGPAFTMYAIDEDGRAKRVMTIEYSRRAE